MVKRLRHIFVSSREILFQIILHAVVFLFYSFEQRAPHIEAYKVAYFFFYAFATFIINYILLPRFYYEKKHVQFFLLLLAVIAGVILFEELVLEQIFFPDTRAIGFPGVFFTLVQVMPVITILVGFKFGWDALVKQREVNMLRAAVQDSELQYLKSQINPHFLFNNLHNLYAYAIENSPKTPDIILELSGVLRYMLYECREKYVQLSKEVAHLDNFVKLNELQIEDRGQVSFTTQNIRAGYQIAPLILIVFVENAFKHSTASQANQIVIDISVELSEAGVLHFICKNTYQEQSNTDNLTKGIGLENVKKRLQLLYPEAHQLNIKKQDETYEVRLSVDLKKHV